MKVEWRSLDLMTCVLGFRDTNTTRTNKDSRDECVDVDAITDHLDIGHKQMPHMEKAASVGYVSSR